MLLVTGAAGKTGRAIVKALAEQGDSVRALVKRRPQVDDLKAVGAHEVIIGDMENYSELRNAVVGVKVIYHICPNMHPEEVKIGQYGIEAAREEGGIHFLYHSVLHPQTEKMPHHWNKLKVEEMLFESGLDFTILQPAAYMQNVLASKNQIFDLGEYQVPYPVSTKLSMIDLTDLADVVSSIAKNLQVHKGAIYELVSTERPLSQTEVASIISSVISQKIEAKELDLEQWKTNALESGIGTYQVETLVKMFKYYARYGFTGNSNVLQFLLRRKPKSFSHFVEREFKF